LTTAFRELDRVFVYDNSQPAGLPEVIFSTRQGRPDYVPATPPAWLILVLQGTEFDLRSGGDA